MHRGPTKLARAPVRAVTAATNGAPARQLLRWLALYYNRGSEIHRGNICSYCTGFRQKISHMSRPLVASKAANVAARVCALGRAAMRTIAAFHSHMRSLRALSFLPPPSSASTCYFVTKPTASSLSTRTGPSPSRARRRLPSHAKNVGLGRPRRSPPPPRHRQGG
jgi:hypothetical protein